jgi:hypothetical protein
MAQASRREAAVATVKTVGGPACVLDAGVPWPRTPDDVAREWARLEARYARITVVGRRTMADLSSAERFVVGVRAAARWTRGEVEKSPVCLVGAPLTGQGVRDELDAAEALMEARGRHWEYATGVLHWLLWVTGASEDLPYPRP